MPSKNKAPNLLRFGCALSFLGGNSHSPRSGGFFFEAMAKKYIEWDLIEPHYRAGIRPIGDMAKEFGCSAPAIVQHARRNGWVRDLSSKIAAKTAAIVAQAVKEDAAKNQGKAGLIKARQVENDIVTANAAVGAGVDLANRADVILAMSVSRTHLKELEALSNPDFAQTLAEIGKMMDQTTVKNGREVKDRVNEAYQYIISLAGRTKIAKDIASAVAVHIPLQRRIFKLEGQGAGASEIDELLTKVLHGES